MAYKLPESSIAKSIIGGQAHETVWFDPEVHFGEYQNQGYADLVVNGESKSGKEWCRVIEIKSDLAIEEAHGAQDIIRQFNKMRKHFFSNNPEYRLEDKHWVSYILCFAATDYTATHVFDNALLYDAAQLAEPWEIPPNSKSAKMAHPRLSRESSSAAQNQTDASWRSTTASPSES
ncbi:hypothetical protein [Haladaptatus sp. GCM10025893]|uniref:hypothetical protein n=1 Tax=Haladaptatus sp. GCM10025893 TaxID=3252659 RepID=UPI00361885F7